MLIVVVELDDDDPVDSGLPMMLSRCDAACNSVLELLLLLTLLVLLLLGVLSTAAPSSSTGPAADAGEAVPLSSDDDEDGV